MDEVALAPADPPEWGLGIATNRRLNQILQRFQQPGFPLDLRLAAAARPANAARQLDIVAPNSARPRPIVLRATPVASETAVIPPQPADNASFATNNRRARSSRYGASLSKRALTTAMSIIPIRPSSSPYRIRSSPTRPDPARSPHAKMGRCILPGQSPIRLFRLRPLEGTKSQRLACCPVP